MFDPVLIELYLYVVFLVFLGSLVSFAFTVKPEDHYSVYVEVAALTILIAVFWPAVFFLAALFGLVLILTFIPATILRGLVLVVSKVRGN